MNIEDLTYEQKEVFQALVGHKNIFLTGEAGTGKSYVVTKYDEYCTENKIKLIKLAPTGVAANRIEGATIHSQFELQTGPLIETPHKYPKILEKVDVVLIDEISMVRLDLFDYIMKQIEMANSARGKQIQIILVGDFFQLPPVMPKQDKQILNDVYKCDIGKAYPFQSRLWKTLNFKTYILKQIIRQSDAEFCKVLTNARYGDFNSVDYIEDHCSKKPVKGAIWLAGKNKSVSDINEARLAKIDSKEYSFKTEEIGDISPQDYPCDTVFKFKIGARVMALINDKEKQFQNGSLGEVIEYGVKEIKGPFGSIDADCVTVKFDNGNEVDIPMHDFENCKYEMDDKKQELKRTVIGTANQFPLKLAYAITVHKSQGQTFEEMNFLPEIFDDGQFYVAVSRCKSIEKMYIHGSVNKNNVRASEEVMSFYKNPSAYDFFGRNFIRVEINKEMYENMFKYIDNNDEFYKEMKKYFDLKKSKYVKEPEAYTLKDFGLD